MTFDPTGLLQPPVGRRAARRAEQRRRRRRVQRVGGGLAGVLALVLALSVLTGGPGEDNNDAGDGRTQRTLLLQVQGPDRTAVATVLLAHDPERGEGAAVLVPPQVIATVPGAGSQLLGKALATVGVDGTRNALADLMGVTVDGSWVLDVATFQRLVDTEGGIQVTVDVPILRGRTVLLQPGPQHVDGSRAYAFATYLVPGEQEQSRLARLQAVLVGLLGALPAKVEALVGSLGSGNRHSLPVKDVGAVLEGLRSDSADDTLQYRSLPVVKVDAGTDQTRFRLDEAATRLLVDELLAESVPEGARAVGNRVLVLNGVGTPGLGAKVRDKLVRNGLVFVGSRNAPSFGYAKTLVLVKDATTQGAVLGARVARAIGVPVSSVQVTDQIGSITDVVVIVGKDFRP